MIYSRLVASMAQAAITTANTATVTATVTATATVAATATVLTVATFNIRNTT